MCAAGSKQNKYVDKFFDLLTNWFISSMPHLFCEHIYTALICSMGERQCAFERASEQTEYAIDFFVPHPNTVCANISH